jgi:hypothetical protein
MRSMIGIRNKGWCFVKNPPPTKLHFDCFFFLHIIRFHIGKISQKIFNHGGRLLFCYGGRLKMSTFSIKRKIKKVRSTLIIPARNTVTCLLFSSSCQQLQRSSDDKNHSIRKALFFSPHNQLSRTYKNTLQLQTIVFCSKKTLCPCDAPRLYVFSSICQC